MAPIRVWDVNKCLFPSEHQGWSEEEHVQVGEDAAPRKAEQTKESYPRDSQEGLVSI